MIRRATAAALACVLALGLVSCAGAAGSAPPAALRYADNGIEWCTTISIQRDLAIGIPVDIHGDKPITIESVQSVKESAMRIEGTWVVPIDPDNRIGSLPWPIPADQTWWPKRHQAADATLNPGEHNDLVLHVRYTGPRDGSLRDVTITYKQDGESRTADTHYAVRMLRGDC